MLRGTARGAQGALSRWEAPVGPPRLVPSRISGVSAVWASPGAKCREVWGPWSDMDLQDWGSALPEGMGKGQASGSFQMGPLQLRPEAW